MKLEFRKKRTAHSLFVKYILSGVFEFGLLLVLKTIFWEMCGSGVRMALLSLTVAECFWFILFIRFGYQHLYMAYLQMEYTLREMPEITIGIDGGTEAEILCRALFRMNGHASRKNTQDVLVKQAELKALQNQINPHFLYNTLECIRGRAVESGAERIADMTEALSAFFRYSISLQENLVSLEQELQNTKNYFLIQKYRFENRFRMEIRQEQDLCEEECLMPKMTLQPIVENAIYHGLENKISDGLIMIRIIETETRLILQVQDNGMGMTEPVLQKVRESLRGQQKQTEEGHTGIALSNINERIHLHFGYEYGLSVNSEEGAGTEVTVTLPLVKRPIGGEDHETGAFADGAYYEDQGNREGAG